MRLQPVEGVWGASQRPAGASPLPFFFLLCCSERRHLSCVRDLERNVAVIFCKEKF